MNADSWPQPRRTTTAAMHKLVDSAHLMRLRVPSRPQSLTVAAPASLSVGGDRLP
jgi:hypothetical protein